MNQDIGLVCGQVVYLLDFNLAFFFCLENGINDDMSGLSVRNLSDGKCVLVYL